MPKKSNKTDHVLNLLTNGRADDDTAKKQNTVQPLTGASSIASANSAGEQVSFNIMDAVSICSDFGGPQNSLSLFPLFSCLFAMK